MSESNKYTLNQIYENLQMIREHLEVPANGRDEWDTKLTQLTILTGLAAEMQASARAKYERAKSAKIRELVEGPYSPSLIAKMIEGEVSNELALYELSVRLSAGITHSIDAIRSQISLYKTELGNSLK